MQHTARKAKGYVIITEPDAPTVEGETLMCVHCQFLWIVRPGSGKKRGFCALCDGPTCGKKKCEEGCEPFEAAIERMEGKQRLFKVATNWRR